MFNGLAVHRSPLDSRRYNKDVFASFLLVNSKLHKWIVLQRVFSSSIEAGSYYAAVCFYGYALCNVLFYDLPHGLQRDHAMEIITPWEIHSQGARGIDVPSFTQEIICRHQQQIDHKNR